MVVDFIATVIIRGAVISTSIHPSSCLCSAAEAQVVRRLSLRLIPKSWQYACVVLLQMNPPCLLWPLT